MEAYGESMVVIITKAALCVKSYYVASERVLLGDVTLKNEKSIVHSTKLFVCLS